MKKVISFVAISIIVILVVVISYLASKDQKAPVITLEGNEKVVLQKGETYVEEGYTATDNKDGDITALVKRSEYYDKIIYKVEDRSGNFIIKVRYLEYVDNEAPQMVLVGEKVVTLEEGQKYKEEGVKITDNADNENYLEHHLEIKIGLDTNVPGTYKVIYKVQDSSQNVAEIERTVIVTEKKEVPVIKEPEKPEVQEPEKPEVQEPEKPEVQEPEKPEVQEPEKPEVQEPEKPEVQEPEKPEVQEPEKPEVQEPEKPEEKEPEKPEEKEPEKQSNKVVQLTFDDGPSIYTERLLDILKANNVQATFFVTNANPKYNYLFKRMQEEGHTVALHTASHEFSDIYSSEEAYYADLNKISSIVEAQIGYAPKIVRFPGGSSNTVSKKYCVGIMTKLSKSIVEKGYSYFDWNVDSEDASGKKLSSTQVKDNVINSLREGRVNIVLQHDIKEFSVNAVDSIIKEAKEMGYTFDNIDNSTPSCKHGVNN